MAQDPNAKEAQYMESGYLQFSMSGSDPQKVWAAFDLKRLEIHLFEDENSLQEPKEIIFLQTCKDIADTSKDGYIICEDKKMNAKPAPTYINASRSKGL